MTREDMITRTRARALALLTQPLAHEKWVTGHNGEPCFCIGAYAPIPRGTVYPKWYSESSDELVVWTRLVGWLEDAMWQQALNL